jgi:ribosome biogenesis GTPase
LNRYAALDVALVVAGHGRHCVIETPEGERLHAHARGKKSDAVVGDRVRFLPTADGEGVVEHIEPRRNLLMRQDAARSKSFAANIDQLLVVVASEPPFSESQLARALIAANDAGVPAVVLLNKIDLQPAADAARERLAPYRAIPLEVLEV